MVRCEGCFAAGEACKATMEPLVVGRAPLPLVTPTASASVVVVARLAFGMTRSGGMSQAMVAIALPGGNTNWYSTSGHNTPNVVSVLRPLLVRRWSLQLVLHSSRGVLTSPL